MYKVFTEKSVIIIDENSDFSNHNDYLDDVEWFKNQIDNETKWVQKKVNQPQKVFQEVFNGFRLIEAAGGLVLNDQNEFLVIYRLDRWDLPKGKLEEGESVETAAVREVEEECGVQNLKISRKLLDTYHTYELKGESILKKTYWFEMEYHGADTLVPQTEEGITDVKWLPWEEREAIFSNTYENIKEVINAKMTK